MSSSTQLDEQIRIVSLEAANDFASGPKTIRLFFSSSSSPSFRTKVKRFKFVNYTEQRNKKKMYIKKLETFVKKSIIRLDTSLVLVAEVGRAFSYLVNDNIVESIEISWKKR